MSGISEEAKCYETVGREGYLTLSRHFDLSIPFPEYSGAASALLSSSEEDLLSRWERVSSAFETAGRLEVIGHESKLFPQGYDGRFLYLAGNPSLLCYPRVTVVGSLQPSVQAKSDTLSFISELLRNESAVLAPLERGLSSYALSVALKLGGMAIGVASSRPGAEVKEDLRPLKEELEDKGLVISVFAPSEEVPAWAPKLRNAFLSSITSSLFLPEERDGGPAWAVADPVLERGGRVMFSKNAVMNPVFTWMKGRAEKDVLLFSRERDARKLLPKRKAVDTSPDLFS